MRPNGQAPATMPPTKVSERWSSAGSSDGTRAARLDLVQAVPGYSQRRALLRAANAPAHGEQNGGPTRPPPSTVRNTQEHRDRTRCRRGLPPVADGTVADTSELGFLHERDTHASDRQRSPMPMRTWCCVRPVAAVSSSVVRSDRPWLVPNDRRKRVGWPITGDRGRGRMDTSRASRKGVLR
jgi:hypothetical protein